MKLAIFSNDFDKRGQKHWVKNPAIALQNSSIGVQRLSIKFKVWVNVFCCSKTKHGDDYHNYDDDESKRWGDLLIGATNFYGPCRP